MALSAVVYRLVTDEAFRLSFKTAPEQALVASGFDLNPQEIEALCSIPWNMALSSLILPDGLFEDDLAQDWGACQPEFSLIQPRPSTIG